MIDNHISSSWAWSTLQGSVLQVVAKMPDILSTPTNEGFDIKTSFPYFRHF